MEVKKKTEKPFKQPNQHGKTGTEQLTLEKPCVMKRRAKVLNRLSGVSEFDRFKIEKLLNRILKND